MNPEYFGLMERVIIHCLYDKLIPLGELRPHPKNRNKHPKEQLERLAKILNYQGWRYPIKVSKQSGYITSGHGRLEAASINGWTEVPVNYQDYETPDQEYLDVQSDNAIASWAELDLSGINMDLGDLGPMDIDLLGIKDFVIEPIEKLEPGCDEDEVPEKVEPKTRLGDLYSLGNHRLLCGDSTSIDAVEKLMDGKKADMVFTDPPYGMKLNTDYSMNWGKKSARGGRLDLKDLETKNYDRVKGDDKEFDFLTAYALFEYCEEQFWWGADYYCQQLPKGCGWLVWDKTGGNDSLASVGFNANFELVWSKQKHKRDLIKYTWKGVAGMKKEDGSRIHPTQKPVGLAEHFLKEWATERLNIVDLFGGSGSTLIACEKTNRRCFMMELEPHYCDVIIARFEKYSGKKAVLLNGPTEETN